MAQVNTSGGTSFSELKSAYVAGGLTDASGDASLKDGSTDINLSYFRNANFTDGTSVPGSGEIRIGTRFINSDTGTGRTFGSSATTYYLQLNNDDALTNIRYTIDASTYLSWTSGAGGDPTNAVITAIGNSGELVYTDTNNEISVSIQRQDSKGNWANATSITLFDTSGGSGLTVPNTPTADNTFTITWSATGSPGSPQILGISSD